MSNASDSSTSTTSSSGSRFNRGFYIRIVAVVLFLGLGTFAVSQSLQSKTGEPHAHGDHDHGEHEHGDESQDPSTENSDTGNENKFVISTPLLNTNKLDSTKAEKESPASQPNQFKLSSDAKEVKQTADIRPSVVPRETNRLAKPAVQQADTRGGGGFTLNPKTNILDTAKEKANEFKQDVNQLGQNIAEKTRDLLDKPAQSLSDLKLPNRGNQTQKPDTTSPFKVDSNGFGPTKTTESNPANRSFATQQPSRDFSSLRQENTSQSNQQAQQPTNTAGFDNNRNLSPLRQEPNPQPQRDFAKSRFDNPPTRESNINAAPPADRQLRGNFNLPNQTARTQPNTQGNFATPPANLRNPQLQTPSAQPRSFQPSQPAAVQRQAVPAMNTSTSRAIPAPAGGIRTLPTPGEKTLEGTRTPSLTVQRIAPREIQLNTPASFEFIVRNIGKIEANNVRIDDRIPTGTRLLEASPQPTQNAGGAVQWNIGTLGPGQERRIKLKLLPTQPGEIGSVAQVSFGTFSSVRTLVTKPELEITHSAPAKSLIGDRVPLDIVVTNKGNGPATKVIIQEDIPNQLEYNDGFRQIEYEIGTLAPGQSRKLQLNLKAANIGALRNVISAKATGGLTAQHAINMEIVAPRLAATSNGPRRRYLRRQATHQFEVRNNGTAAATNVELMAKLPAGLKYVSSNNRGQFDAATNAVYWSLAELDPSVAATVELTTVPVATGDQPIGFTAVADLKQKATVDAALMVEHLVDVFFDIDDLVDHIEIGSDTKYQIRIVNQGTKTATNVRLQLDLPNGIRPKDVEGGLQSQIQGQRVVFAPITSMNPGDEIKVAINATGVAAGEHKVVASMQSDGRQTSIQKEETTQVYADR